MTWVSFGLPVQPLPGVLPGAKPWGPLLANGPQRELESHCPSPHGLLAYGGSATAGPRADIGPHRLGAQHPGARLAEPSLCHPESSWQLRGSRAQALCRALTNSCPVQSGASSLSCDFVSHPSTQNTESPWRVDALCLGCWGVWRTPHLGTDPGTLSTVWAETTEAQLGVVWALFGLGRGCCCK